MTPQQEQTIREIFSRRFPVVSKKTKTRIVRTWVVDGVGYETVLIAARATGKTAGTIHKWCNGYKREGIHFPPKFNCCQLKEEVEVTA